MANRVIKNNGGDFQLLIGDNCITYQDLRRGRDVRISYKNIDFVEFNKLRKGNGFTYELEVIIQLIHSQPEFTNLTVSMVFNCVYMDEQLTPIINFVNKKIDGEDEQKVVLEKPKKTKQVKKEDPTLVFSKNVKDTDKMKALKKEYLKIKTAIEKLEDELQNKQNEIGKLVKPAWKTETVGKASGMTYTNYYGGYIPVNPLMVVGLFSPLNPICAIYLIVKKVKKGKCLKQLKIAENEYNSKHQELSKRICEIKTEQANLEADLDSILEEANDLE